MHQSEISSLTMKMRRSVHYQSVKIRNHPANMSSLVGRNSCRIFSYLDDVHALYEIPILIPVATCAHDKNIQINNRSTRTYIRTHGDIDTCHASSHTT